MKVLALLIVGAAVVVVAACNKAPVATPFPFTITIATPEPTLDLSNCLTIICCSDCPSIPVDRVIEGDTFNSANGRIRLFGIDAPERGQPCHDEATLRLRELAKDSVRVQRGPRSGDDYGRILFYVFTEQGDSIDEMLAREGLVFAWERDGQHRDVLVAAEKGARRDGRGCLWEGNTLPQNQL